MYGIFRTTTNTSVPTLIATCRTKMGAKSACRHFNDIYTEETGRIPYRITYRRIQSYASVRFNYLILQIVRGMEESRLEKMRRIESKATINRTAQEQRVASLY